MAAATKNFEVYRNADWTYSARLKKADNTYYDLAGTHFRMQVRPDDDSGEVVIELSDENGRITLSAYAGDSPGVLTVWGFTIDKLLVSKLPKGEFIHDVIWTRGTDDTRFLAGAVSIKNGATR